MGAAGGVEYGEFLGRFGAVGDVARDQRAGGGELGGEDFYTRGFVQEQVIRAGAGDFQQLRHHALMHLGVLAQIQRGERPAEHTGGAQEAAEAALCQ